MASLTHSLKAKLITTSCERQLARSEKSGPGRFNFSWAGKLRCDQSPANTEPRNFSALF
jgi:hypothetical protein